MKEDDLINVHSNPGEYGLYGIYVNSNLVYIGKTIRTYKTRFKEHNDKTINYHKGDPQPQLYGYLHGCYNNNCKIECKPLFLIDKQFSNNDLELMEYALIKTLKPKCNVEGLSVEYNFTSQVLEKRLQRKDKPSKEELKWIKNQHYLK